MSAPNSVLRSVRMGMLMSQDDFARALREAGERTGRPNDASKRLIQRWEAGVITQPRPVYARALEAVTGRPMSSLGFTMSIPGDGPAETGGTTPESAPKATLPPLYSGVWLSRYEYESSSRGQKFTNAHYVLVVQQGDRLTVRSLPGSGSEVTMDLTVDGAVITGTWVEQTELDGYYRGARYHGAIQLLVEPTGHQMRGKWVGFGSDLSMNTGPWELILKDQSTNKATLSEYSRPVD